MENIPAKPQIHEHPLTGALLLLLFILVPLALAAQDPAPLPSAKTQKQFNKALEAFRTRDYAEAEGILKRLITHDSTYADAWILLGDLQYEKRDLDEAAAAYSRALALEPSSQAIVRNLLANTLFESEKYDEAALHYEILDSAPGLRPDLKHILQGKLEISRFRQNLMDNPVPFRPENLGDEVNSSAEEYINALRADIDRIIFTRKSPISDDPMQREFQEEFYMTDFKDTGWAKAERFEFSDLSQGDAGGLSMSADGNMLFFTSCFRKDSEGSCDLYFCEKIEGEWTVPKNMGKLVNSDNWDAQPSISPDGKTLYFASNREGSLGSSDIWFTSRLPDGNWTKPENLGAPVNTKDAEMAPHIHFDNQTLYFSSKGHPGMGGHDLFCSKKHQTGWSEPQNIGFPVNTRADELIIVVSPDGRKAFISAELPQGYGGYDIYSFQLPENVRPLPVTYLKGKVYDRENNKPLKAEFQLIDLDLDTVVMNSWSTPDKGTFLVCVPLGANYALNVTCPGYLFYSDHIQLDVAYEQANPYLKDIPLEPVRIGKTLILKNIFFETNQYDLLDESKSELNKLVIFLEENPGIHIEISGHTDNVGTPEYNMELSGKRAESVVAYLLQAGIARQRLTSAGYGLSRPIAPNDSETGRAENRRTEIRILELMK